MNHQRPTFSVLASFARGASVAPLARSASFARLGLLAALGACTVTGPPAFPDGTTAQLVGPLCESQSAPCLCADNAAETGAPPEGLRRFEIRLPATRGTASAAVVEGVGALLRDEDHPGGSCFYIDLRPGATYHLRYLARAHSRERGISVAFGIREVAPMGGWYDVISQQCGSSDSPCGYESVADWTAAFGGGHRFNDPCGSTLIEEVRVEGGIFDQRFEDAQFSFDLEVVAEPPTRAPGSSCQRAIDGHLMEIDAGPEPADAGDDAAQ